jgi:hypothetical protein
MAGEITFSLNINNKISEDITRKQKQLSNLPNDVFIFFRDITPVQTGNARRNTRFDKAKGEIVANYAYAEVLDQGRGVRGGQMRGSTQAPKGMSKPSEEFMAKRLKTILRKP